MKNHELELLAPAGSFESLKAAILNGADAVYLGGGKFNARINANNFNEDDLVKAIDYAHERDVKIYVTLNTLIKNDEVYEALKFAEYIYNQGTDAVIVQDIGLLSLLKKYLPDLTLHASTQMTVANNYSVTKLANMGAKRIVLARELSLKEIKEIAYKTGTELEVFVHGAICVCYSGQCLMSSFIGSRSGNRGLCAQPCRLPYSISNKVSDFSSPSYLLSTRDLSAIDLLPKLKEVGVTSLKLEGRMKSAEYVAVVTSVYRKYIDLLMSGGEKGYRVKDIDRKRLLQAFNRGGFTDTYLKAEHNSKKLIYSKHPKNQGVHIGKVLYEKPPYIKIKIEEDLNMGDGIEIMDEERGTISFIVSAIMINNKHVRLAKAGTTLLVGDIKTHVKKGSEVYRTLSKSLFSDARKTFENNEKTIVPLSMILTLNVGQNVALEAVDNKGNRAKAKSDILAEKAINKPLDQERIRAQLKKMDKTPYYLDKLTIYTDNKSIVPISTLNALRRKVLKDMRDIRVSVAKKNVSVETICNKSVPERKDKGSANLSAFFYEYPTNIKNFNNIISRIYLPTGSVEELRKAKNEYKGEIFLWTFPVLKDDELDRVMKQAEKALEYWDGITYGSLGAMEVIKQTFPKKLICADYNMNLFNNQAIMLQKELGANSAVLSPELRLSEVEQFSCPGVKLEAMVYGRVPLMIMENCPSAQEAGCSMTCGKCSKNRGVLKDRKGEIFPYVRDNTLKRTVVFNSYPVFMDDTKSLKNTNLSLYRLTFTREDIDYSEQIAMYYYKKVMGENIVNISDIEEIKSKGYTKGHWFRGV